MQPEIHLKRCTGCGENKPATREYFYKHYSTKDRLRSKCKQCVVTVTTTWRAENPEKRQAANANRYKTHIEKISVYHRKYRATHKKEHCVESQRRTAKKNSLPNSYTEKDWVACCQYFHNCCAVCGSQIDLFGERTLSQDHWIPLSKGGGYVVENIVPLCHGRNGCNNSKSNQDAHVWLSRKFGKKQVIVIETRIADYFSWAKGNRDATA